MTNAEWMLRKGYKFEFLGIERKENDDGTVPTRYRIFRHRKKDGRIVYLHEGYTYANTPSYRLIDMWLDAKH